MHAAITWIRKEKSDTFFDRYVTYWTDFIAVVRKKHMHKFMIKNLLAYSWQLTMYTTLTLNIKMPIGLRSQSYANTSITPFLISIIHMSHFILFPPTSTIHISYPTLIIYKSLLPYCWHLSYFYYPTLIIYHTSLHYPTLDICHPCVYYPSLIICHTSLCYCTLDLYHAHAYYHTQYLPYIYFCYPTPHLPCLYYPNLDIFRQSSSVSLFLTSTMRLSLTPLLTFNIHVFQLLHSWHLL